MRNLCCSVILFAISMIAQIGVAEMSQDQIIEERLRPKRFVLSIGIGHFNNPIWHNLRFASKDANDVYSEFTSDAVGFDGGELLVSSASQPVDLEQIKKSFQRLELENHNEDDTIVVYLSTHGTVAYREDGKIGRYIITSQTDPKNLKETALDYDALISWFHNLKSRKKVLILAFCHSGVGKSVLTPEMKRALAELKAPYFEEPIQERSEGSIILTASGWREPALEDAKLKNDVYTHFLLQGFQEDLNRDGAVSITEAHQFASQKTYQHTEGRQRPSAILELLGADPILIRGEVTANRNASLFSLMSRFSKLLVAIDGQEIGTLEKGLVVPEGKVRLTVKDPATKEIVADRVVSFEGGREYSIANYLIPQLPNNISIAADHFYVANPSVRKGYISGNPTGIRLRYRRDESISIYDLDLSLAWFSANQEMIQTNGVKFRQHRRLFLFDVQMGLRNLIKSLSANDRSIQTEARWLFGPSLLLIQRKVDDIAFEQKKASSLVPGISLGTGLDMILPYHLVKFSVNANFGVYQNFASDGPQLITSTSATFGVGTFW